MILNAKEILGQEFPPDEGKRLADDLLARDINWRDLTIDVSSCSPSLLISAFFNGFLQEIFERKASLLDDARLVKWRFKFSFQEENVARWMREFAPVPA